MSVRAAARWYWQGRHCHLTHSRLTPTVPLLHYSRTAETGGVAERMAGGLQDILNTGDSNSSQ